MEKEIKVTELNLVENFFTMGDSMLYDSGVDIAWGKILIDGEELDFSIGIRGEMRVYYKDRLYRYASDMPKELIDLFENGKAYDSSDVEIIDNNWYEIIIDDRYDVFDMNPNEILNEKDLIECIESYSKWM